VKLKLFVVACTLLSLHVFLAGQTNGTQAVVRRVVAPRYPQYAQLSGAQGTVEAVARVNGRGEILDVGTLSGPSIFGPEVKRVLPLWRCEPCDAGPADCKLKATFTFKLSGLCTLPECATDVYFELPNTVVITSQRARAIPD
jgi:hypothetical protein